ncbi:expressed unknown protein [Seminavis robusta]|uniref:Transmembrane protein n=1 Tax=Seminavis robusta TaxID=568900 RepID=A0A9N8H3Z8_9STRA|nr:expressed unknown protein [Seminavis robusta]|eukprot:Sro37_g023460.1 n/a (561) ;mRNA; f:142133-143815
MCPIIEWLDPIPPYVLIPMFALHHLRHPKDNMYMYRSTENTQSTCNEDYDDESAVSAEFELVGQGWNELADGESTVSQLQVQEGPLWCCHWTLNIILRLAEFLFLFPCNRQYRDDLFESSNCYIKPVLQFAYLFYVKLALLGGPFLLFSIIYFWNNIKPVDELVYLLLPIYQTMIVVLPCVATIRYVCHTYFPWARAAIMIVGFFAYFLVVDYCTYMAGLWVHSPCANFLIVLFIVVLPIGAVCLHLEVTRLENSRITTPIILIYALSMVVLSFWSFWVKKANNDFEKIGTSIVFALLHFFLKNALLVRKTKDEVSGKFLHLLWAADIIFSRQQVATIPFIVGGRAFGTTLCFEMLGLVWRCLPPERVMLLVDRMIGYNGRVRYVLRSRFGRKPCAIVCGVLGSSTKDILKMTAITKPDAATRRRGYLERALFHYMDAIATLIIKMIVRLNQVFAFFIMRNRWAREHVDQVFNIDDSSWVESWKPTLLLVGVDAVAILIAWYAMIRPVVHAEHDDVTLPKILYYILRHEFWFLFWFFLATGTQSVASMVVQFAVPTPSDP